MGLILKVLLFICAYSPLISILIFQKIPDLSWYWILLGILPLLISLFFCLLVYFITRANSGSETQTIADVEDKTNDVVAYIIPYIISLSTFVLDGIRGLIILGILMVLLYAIYANSSMIYINPLLSLIGYRIYKIEISDEKSTDRAMLISRNYIRKNQIVSTYELADGVYLEIHDKS